MKKLYTDPKMELILFGSDIITTSSLFGSLTQSADNNPGKDTLTSFNS